MAQWRKRLGIGVLTLLMLAGLMIPAVWATGHGGCTASFGGESRGFIRFTGTVVCTQCRLDEIQAAQPQLASKLYQLTYPHGQLVIHVMQVNDSDRWMTLFWPPRIPVRTTEALLAQLTAEENMFKEVEITGLLGNARILDIFAVVRRG
ncbi:MAG: hypothetical protein AB1671_01955 [Thermodesulfobacteriota bacterium]